MSLFLILAFLLSLLILLKLLTSFNIFQIFLILCIHVLPPFHPFRSKSSPITFTNPIISTHPNLSSYLRLTKQALLLCKFPSPKPNLSPCQQLALHELSQLKKIVLIKADKGDTIVLMDVAHYLQLAYTHLNDHTTYRKLTSDPTPDIVI